MPTEAPARAAGRPRPWLLVLFGIVGALFLWIKLAPTTSDAPAAAPRTQARTAAGGGSGQVNPEDLQVRLDALKTERPQPADAARNPFRFQPKPEPAPPPPPKNATVSKPVADVPPGPPPPPPGPPPPPAITLKFIGTVEGRETGGKVAAFSDPPSCKRTFYAREGEIVDGRYRLVKIGIESVVMEYPDGRGRQTIRQGGQECVGK